ncbi:MAG: DUF2793 domain-containing protein [Sphingorhabdus sp.]
MNTPRFALPHIMVAQAHKEITHNEALAKIDALLHLSVVGTAVAPPTLTSADSGQCWIVGATSASGDWVGNENAIASWNGASWTMIDPVAGMRAWDHQAGVELRFLDGEWQHPATINDPQGGAVIDVEARLALVALLNRLRSVGMIGE